MLWIWASPKLCSLVKDKQNPFNCVPKDKIFRLVQIQSIFR